MGFYGSTLVQRIAEADYADEVVMTDIIEGKPQGLALDMMQSRSIEGFETRIVGTNGYDETAGSDVCVITAGLPRKPGMSRMDLLEVNAKIVGDVTNKLVAGSPDAVIIVVSNPLDEMTALCAKVAGLPKARVMGQAGMLDTARFKHFVAERLDASPVAGRGHDPRVARRDHGARALTGEGRRQAPRATCSTTMPSKRSCSERDGGAEIVGVPQDRLRLLRAVVGRRGRWSRPSSRQRRGHAGVRVGRGPVRRERRVPGRAGPHRPGGVAEIVELPLTDDELAALRPRPKPCGPSRPTSTSSCSTRTPSASPSRVLVVVSRPGDG